MRTYLTSLLILISFSANANVELPLLFSDGMILQQQQDIPVWGWAVPNETVEIVFKDQKVKTLANDNGQWKVLLKPENYGGPYTLTVKGNNTIEIKDVLIGEVWLCSGQSNMEFAVNGVVNAEKEIADSDYPMIRQFMVPNEMSSEPRIRLAYGQWKESNRNNVGEFTAVGYFFAKKLYKELGIPIGIINSTWGGTCVETWTSKEALEKSGEFGKLVSSLPEIDIDSMLQLQKQRLVENIEKVQGNDMMDIQSDLSKKDIDDSQWPEMNLPERWDDKVLVNLDGTVWYRKTFNLSHSEAGKKAMLYLSTIDDDDITYINGVEVGRTSGYDVYRKYDIPEGLLVKGENVIAVKIIDYVGGGGIYGKPSDVKLSIGGNDISLAGKWKFNVVNIVTEFSPNSYPSLLFNAMISPIIPYGIKGVLWYQGEANVSRATQYKKSFPLMIENWRERWGEGDFPFYFVQLSSFNEFGGNSNVGSKWAELREAQDQSRDKVPNIEMCVTVDIGNAKDIHPKNKQDVGYRLAAIALNKDYGKAVDFRGPCYISFEVKGNQMILSFNNAEGGLTVKEAEGLAQGFEISGADRRFVKAEVKIEGGKLIVSLPKIENPKSVRYGWADDAGNCNVYNKSGLPMEPFRTDDWELTTEKELYSVLDLY